MDIKIGEALPLSFSTVDAKAGLDVVASVVDCFGKQIANTKLIETSAGVYVSLDVPMPDVPFVVAQYFVQDTDAYEVASELFRSIPKPRPAEKFVEGRVTKRAKVCDYVIGEQL